MTQDPQGSSISNNAIVYINNADNGTIVRCKLDLQSGTLTDLDATEVGKNIGPFSVSSDKKHLYAAVRSEPCRLVTFNIVDQQGKLEKKSEAPLPVSMTFTSIDKENKWLFAAAYHNNMLSVSAINEQGIIVDDVKAVYPTEPHAHAVIVHPNNQFVYAAILGTDKILQYKLNHTNGELTPIEQGYIKATENSGPRHIVISPNGQYLYVVSEFVATVSAYKINQTTGELTLLQHINAFPAEDYDLVPSKLGGITPPANKAPIWGADIKITPNGQFLYTTERSSSRVSLYQVQTNGELIYIENTLVEEQPRGIAIDPTGQYLIATGQVDTKVGVYAIAQQTGKLKRISEAQIGKSANWAEVVIF